MKVLCTESCFNSNELLRFDAGNIYDLDEHALKTIVDSEMGGYFTDEKGDTLDSHKAKAPVHTPKKEGK